ncbi:MAG: hypothetical protein AB7O56_09525 [Bauldia sp.]
MAAIAQETQPLATGIATADPNFAELVIETDQGEHFPPRTYRFRCEGPDLTLEVDMLSQSDLAAFFAATPAVLFTAGVSPLGFVPAAADDHLYRGWRVRLVFEPATTEGATIQAPGRERDLGAGNGGGLRSGSRS